jgi:hypothetical protein
MLRVYLDYNGFQRGFDDPHQVRIQIESLACQEIFNRAERGQIELVWSFMHQDESLLRPFPDRQLEAFRLATLCRVRVGPEQAIYEMAQSYYSTEWFVRQRCDPSGLRHSRRRRGFLNL